MDARNEPMAGPKKKKQTKQTNKQTNKNWLKNRLSLNESIEMCWR